MNQFPNYSPGAAGNPQAHPVVALRDQLTQTVTAASQLESILATVDDPGRRFSEIR